MTSKLSEVNLRIIEVLPTDWSPRKTILYFICVAGLFAASLAIGSVITFALLLNHSIEKKVQEVLSFSNMANILQIKY